MKINYSDQKVKRGKCSIFLAGPTPRDANITSWRKEACDILEKLGFEGIVYVPEYSTGALFKDHNEQAMWEREALTAASKIVFWIPRSLPDMPAFTTNVEFGYWLHTGKIIYGRPNSAVKVRYLDWLYDIDYDKKPFKTLPSLLKAACKSMGKI